MSDTRFEWDPVKAQANRAKHGVTFEEAATVFSDPLVLLQVDLEHGEARQVAIGQSRFSARVLFVVHIEVEDGVIRIISARKATKHEKRSYEDA